MTTAKYWENEGTHQALLDEANALIPSEGKASTPALEVVRLVQNVCYDYFNNGWDCGIANKHIIDAMLGSPDVATLLSASGNEAAANAVLKIRAAIGEYEMECEAYQDEINSWDDEDEDGEPDEPVFWLEDISEGLDALMDAALVAWGATA